MSHTTRIDRWTFIHDGSALDSSAPVTMIDQFQGVRVELPPAAVLAAFVAELIRRERIAALEQAPASALLGVAGGSRWIR